MPIKAKKNTPNSKNSQASPKTKTVKISKRQPSLQSVKGVYEILPEEWRWREKLEQTVKNIAQFYDFERIETGIIESADLFIRSVGETTDIVNKEMYFLKSSREDKLVLRPEGTAPVARAYLQYGFIGKPQPVKLFYLGPMFRHENPQAGRYRQFSSFGFEILGGENDSIFDAQVIQVAFRIIRDLGFKDAIAQVNSIGCKTCQPNLKRKLVSYYKNKTKKICKDCQNRLKINPFRILDCKHPSCDKFKEDAPIFLDGLCQACKASFRNLLEYLDELNLPYEINNNLVRGLDYYNRTVFEIFIPSANNSKLAIASGGRYDYLVEMLGGRPTSGVGFGLGIERLLLAVRAKAVRPPSRPKNRIFFIHVGDVAKKKSLSLIEKLRSGGIIVRESLSKDSVGKQLKLASIEEVKIVLIFGQKEVYEESVILKNLKTGIQETVPLSKIVEAVKKSLQK